MKLKTVVLMWQLAFLAIAATGCSDSVPSDIVPEIDNVPMRQVLVRKFDANSDGKLSPDEVRLIKEVYLNSDMGENYNVLKHLVSLERLEGNGCEIYSLDITDNTKLKDCELRNLDNLKHIKVNKNLQNLIMSRAKDLSEVDLPEMPYLQWLCISRSPLEKLSTGNCPSLTTLTVNDTYLTELDLSKYPRLEEVFCDNTKIETLDLSMLKNLNQVRCKGVKKVIISPEQKIVGLNIDPDYKYCIDRDTEIITKS